MGFSFTSEDVTMTLRCNAIDLCPLDNEACALLWALESCRHS